MSNTAASSSSLTTRTLRMVGVLVAACVVFVGVLSVIAVAVTSRAVNAGSAAQTTATDAPAAKKPLSI